MKRSRKFLALLMALCLLAGLTAVPVAAEETSADIAQLEKALADARNDLATKNELLTNIKEEVGREKEEKGRELETAQNNLKNAEKAVEDAGENATDDQKNEVIKFSGEVESIKKAMQALDKKVTDAENAVEAAEEDVKLKEKALEDAKKEPEPPVPPEPEVCEHGKDPDTCEICHPELKKCPHGKDPKTCPTCNPPATDKAPDRPTNSDFTVSPGSVNIGTVEKGATGSSLSSTFRITNNSKYAMNIKADTCSKFSIDLTSKTLSAGESITVTVSLKSAGSTGSFNDRFTITASFTEGAGDSYSTDVYVSATVTEKGNTITVSPTSKDLGKLAEGYTEKEAKEKEITVEITNKGASSVRMYGVKGNDHFTVTAVDDENIRLDYDDDCEYKIVPKKDLKVGTYTDTIVFQTREGATASFKATIVVEKAVDPLTLNVSSLDFGNAEMGYAGLNTQTVTVKNNTDSPLNLEQPSSYNYEIGSVSRTLSAGGTATFTVRPRTGLAANVYNDSLTIRAGNYSTRLDLRFTVTPKLLLAVFADVAEGSTFAADISYVSQKGLMGGVGNGQFKPQNPITRGQLVTILYRLEGQPAVSGSGFTDVKAGSYCEKAVKWAAACGITNGNKDGTFLPDNPISREQMATFLYRYNNYKGYSTTRRADLSTFPDAASVAPYAKDALSWANGSGLVNGTGEGKLNPSGGATRGQAAAILHRFCVSIGK